MKMTISMEHIHPELSDIQVNVELDVYRGSTEGFCSDDPSELDIVSVVLAEDVTTDHVMLLKGSPVTVDSEINEQILSFYERN